MKVGGGHEMMEESWVEEKRVWFMKNNGLLPGESSVGYQNAMLMAKDMGHKLKSSILYPSHPS